MRRIVLCVIGLAGILAAAQQDSVFDAMQAELKRSMTLTLNQLDKPYYLSYTVDDEHSWSAEATLGGLINSSVSNYRVPRLRMRVGDYNFDNTNWTGANAAGPRYDLRSFPIEDENPLVLRQFLWLATDSAFKGSLQSIARKRAALRSVTVNDVLPDFAPAKPYIEIRDYKPAKFDDQAWVERIKKISAVFSSFPALRSSGVELNAVDSLHRFVNSEGTEIRVPDATAGVEIQARAQASDGMIVRDLAVFYTRDITRMFQQDELTKSAQTLGEQVLKLAAAPMGDNYTGPILFEGAAAPQLLAEILGRNLYISRKPIVAPGGNPQSNTTELEGRRGVRIMPEFFDVVDDPTKLLFGHEEVDEEGVVEKPLSLVEKGVLKDFLRTRQPVRGYDESNGRARLNGSYGADLPVATNLLITAHETSSIADLKKKLLDLVQQRGLPYGMIVRKMDFPSSASVDEARKILAAGASGSSSRPVSMPLYAYRLYPDGHEELVRGERFRGVNARSMKDILAAGDDSTTFNYLDNGAPFALLGYGSGAAEVAIVAPSLLIDDLELTKVDDELPKLPIVPSPSAAGSQTAALK
ncbi:MAG TPA: metallopeptidase TldD-related protein [Bryobacteraceae bacterium]|nr:metallopeptidase TldD-related protein [Bryobacteraceae bacterium]